MGHDSDYAFTKEGFFANWIRHKAYFLGKCNFKAIDLVIPMAFLMRKNHDEQDIIDLESMSYIVISVKNKTSGSELKRQTYLSTNEVEGVSSENGTTKTRMQKFQSQVDPSLVDFHQSIYKRYQGRKFSRSLGQSKRR